MTTQSRTFRQTARSAPKNGYGSLGDEHRELLARVAEMYYEANRTQSQIASELRYSRSMISRFLTEAREAGVVEIRINHPLQRRMDLEAALKERFGLQAVRVLAHTSTQYPVMLRRLGGLAASVVADQIHDGDVVGVTWGLSLADTVAAMRPEPRKGVIVAQMIGSLGTLNPDNDGPELTRKLARALGAEYRTLPAPLFVDSEQARELLVRGKPIRQVLNLARKTRVLVAGIGSTDLDNSTLVKEGMLTREQATQLLRVGAVGDMCARHFNRDGKILDTALSHHMIGIDEARMRAIPTRIGVAGGATKIAPVLGALRGKLINVLVTDEIAATGVLGAI